MNLESVKELITPNQKDNPTIEDNNFSETNENQQNKTGACPTINTIE